MDRLFGLVVLSAVAVVLPAIAAAAQAALPVLIVAAVAFFGIRSLI
jgi:hypothetical protein